MYIVDPLVSDEELDAIINRYRQVVIDQGGEVLQAGKWEKRRLAYEIEGRREGIYVLMNFRSGPKAAAELERVLRLAEPVLRHIIVRQEPGKSLYINLEKLGEVKEAELVEATEDIDVEAIEEEEESPIDEAAEAEVELADEAEIEMESAVEEEFVPTAEEDLEAGSDDSTRGPSTADG